MMLFAPAFLLCTFTQQGVWEPMKFDERFTSLLEGGVSKHWHVYKKNTVTSGWAVRDGVLALDPGDDDGDLVTNETFANFELRLEWKIAPGGNSGIIYRCTEEQLSSWRTGAEYQLLDNEGNNDNGTTLHSAGADYDMYAPAKNVCKKAGEWNEARLVARGTHIEHYLNGVKVVDYVVGSNDWNSRLGKSKFKDMPGYGVQTSGHIALQNHGAKVWFRDIKIKKL